MIDVQCAPNAYVDKWRHACPIAGQSAMPADATSHWWPLMAWCGLPSPSMVANGRRQTVATHDRFWLTSLFLETSGCQKLPTASM